jgi:hypothetical protein
MTTSHHTPLPFGGPLTSNAMEAPLGQLDAAIDVVSITGSGTSTTLTAQATAGQPSLTVANSAGFLAGDPIYIGTGVTFESRIINNVPNATTIVVTVNLSNTYAIGAPISKSPVEIVDARGSYTTLGARIGTIEQRVYDVKRYGATGDGATDDRAAIQAAIDAAQASSGGTIYFPPGNYRVTAQILVTKPTISLVGTGARASKITSASTADAIRVAIAVWTVEQAGRIAGLTIIGNANANAVGVHISEATGFELDDVVVVGFTGTSGIGVHVENTTNWTERLTLKKTHLDNNKVGLKFSVSGTGTTSFGFARILDLRLNVNNGQTGILLVGTARLYNAVLTAMCNVDSAGIVLDVQGTSSVTGVTFAVHGEQTAGVGGTGFKVASGAKIWGYGIVKLDALPHSNANAASYIASLRIVGPEAGPGGPPSNSQDHGTFASYQGGGNTGYPVAFALDRVDQTQASMGFVVGTGIVSPFVAMYGDATHNAFVVYATAFGQAIAAAREVWKVNPNAKMTLVSPAGVTPEVVADGADTNVNLILKTKGTGVVAISYAQVAVGGGATATMGTIGGSGPAAAAMSGWLKVLVNGNSRFVPLWA